VEFSTFKLGKAILKCSVGNASFSEVSQNYAHFTRTLNFGDSIILFCQSQNFFGINLLTLFCKKSNISKCSCYKMISLNNQSSLQKRVSKLMFK
jgi:hypothetical protein